MFLEIDRYEVVYVGVYSKRGVQKRVVSVPIGDVEGSKSKGETYPPSDSWAWRKYGQKPIKGSPYPRHAICFLLYLFLLILVICINFGLIII